MRGAFVAILLVTLASIAPAAADDACPGAAQGFQRVKHGDLEFAFRWEPAELKVGQFFSAEVVACGVVGRPSTEGGVFERPSGRLIIDAEMPAHGHRMNYRPKAERIRAGHYRFTGLMLHMPGTWRFRFAVFPDPSDIGFSLTHDADIKR